MLRLPDDEMKRPQEDERMMPRQNNVEMEVC